MGKARERLKHKLRKVERKMGRQVKKAKRKEKKALRKERKKATGVSPVAYTRAVAKAKQAMRMLKKEKKKEKKELKKEKKKEKKAIKKIEKKAVKKEKKIAKVAEKKVLKATGIKAQQGTLLARRRSSNTRMTKLLGKIKAPKALAGRRRSVIPKSMASVLTKTKSNSVRKLKRKLANLLKPGVSAKAIKRADKARKAKVKKKIAQIKSKIKYKLAIKAQLKIGKMKKKERK